MKSNKSAAASLAVVGAFLCFSGCGGGSSQSSTATSNTLALAVNTGPGGNYANGLFATVTVCAPGTSNCQAISGVLVDTGSFGLRILSSALNSSVASALTSEKNGSGADIVECAQFSDGITWGPVKAADVKLGDEKAGSLPVQIIGDPSFATVPASCTSAGSPEDSLQALGTNGILGIGNFVQDCPACSPGTTSNPGFYYACTGSSCAVTAVGLTQQVANPVAFLPADNNGLVVELPAASSSQVSLSGSLIFGIGTQRNNSLAGAQVFMLDPQTGNFTTTFMNHAYTNASFLDSGSNAYFFLSSNATGLPACSTATGFYCPASAANFSATTTGSNNARSTISFSIGNAETLFTNAADAVFPSLGGPFAGMFDWGLPFFYGRNVFVAINGRTTPGGTGPYWAF